MKYNVLHQLENCLFILEAGLTSIKQNIINIYYNDSTGEYTIILDKDQSSETAMNKIEMNSMLEELVRRHVTDHGVDDVKRAK